MYYQAATLLALAASTAIAHPTGLFRRQETSNGKSAKQGITVKQENFSSAIAKYPKASWIHNWNYKPIGSLPQGIEYVPELQKAAFGYGDDGSDTTCSNFRNSVKNAQHVLSINEPDFSGAGTNLMSPADAAKLHSTCLNGLGGPKVGSPSVTSHDAPTDSYNFLTNWWTECEKIGGCDMDFVSVHYEGTLDSFDSFFVGQNGQPGYIDKVQEWSKSHGNKPVWLTEFRCVDASQTDKDQCLGKLVNWLETSSVERYAAYLIDDASGQNVGGSTAAAYNSIQ